MKESKNGAKLVKGIIFGAVVGMGIMLILCFLGGVLLSKEILPEAAIGYVGWVICGVAAWIGCWFAQKKAGGGRLPVSLGCGAVLLLCMLIVAATGEVQQSLTWYSAAIVGVCAAASALLASGKRKRRR